MTVRLMAPNSKASANRRHGLNGIPNWRVPTATLIEFEYLGHTHTCRIHRPSTRHCSIG